MKAEAAAAGAAGREVCIVAAPCLRFIVLSPEGARVVSPEALSAEEVGLVSGEVRRPSGMPSWNEVSPGVKDRTGRDLRAERRSGVVLMLGGSAGAALVADGSACACGDLLCSKSVASLDGCGVETAMGGRAVLRPK